MKIDRLIGILSILLQRDDITASYLAERFEVSKRTISRDIDDLGKAGIPVTARQGRNGGIRIMEGYHIDKTLLTADDKKAILAGLRSLDSVCSSRKYQQLMEKLSGENSDVLPSNDHILINLSSWYKDTLAPKIGKIQELIERRELMQFRYYAPAGESHRVIEPYLLLFQWASWYVWGYCREKEDFRMFKLNRMDMPKGTGEQFEQRPLPAVSAAPEEFFPENKLEITVLLKPELKWRLIEEFGIGCFEECQDGKLLFRQKFTDQDSVFGWLLSFGPEAELIEPTDLREEFRKLLKKYEKIYG